VKNPQTGALAPHFIVVANQAAPDGGKAIAAGNSRVLSARLADAQFFQSEDAKTENGSIKDKAERVAALARELAPKVGADPDLAETAAKLAKCDLVTNMVIEFTSLEGQIGRLMYEREHGISPLPAHPSRGDTFSPREKGYSESEGRAAIALAIEEHYKPKGPSDAVPTNPVAVAVALADKLDTLVGFWAIDEKPTGSKDPFALRRAALGVVRIILENDVRLQLKYFLIIANMRVVIPDTVKKGQALKVTISEFWARQKVSGLRGFDLDDISSQIDKITKKASAKSLMAPVHGQNNLLEFLADRLKVYLRDKGIRHDLIDAVFALGEDDLVAIVNRVTALQFFLSTEDGENLLAGYKRAANILKAEAKKGDLPEGLIWRGFI